jgi:CBS domain-containing protein
MTREVVVVGTEVTVRDVAQLLVHHAISAVPVVDAERRVIGIVSEGDLLRRGELGTQTRHRSWLAFLADPAALAADYVKTHGLLAGEVMTPSPVVVAPETPLSEIASLMERNRIKRVPVVEGGKLVGIVSRSNLVQVLATVPTPAAPATSDRAIRDALVAELNHQPWARRLDSNVVVRDGVVYLWGVVQAESERQALRVAAEQIPGVRGIEDHLTVASIPVIPGF